MPNSCLLFLDPTDEEMVARLYRARIYDVQCTIPYMQSLEIGNNRLKLGPSLPCMSCLQCAAVARLRIFDFFFLSRGSSSYSHLKSNTHWSNNYWFLLSSRELHGVFISIYLLRYNLFFKEEYLFIF